MPEFTQSWAFWFIIGCFAVAVIAFIVWIICAAGSKGSRMEERISSEAIYEAAERERKRRGGCPEPEIANQNNPRTD